MITDDLPFELSADALSRLRRELEATIAATATEAFMTGYLMCAARHAHLSAAVLVAEADEAAARYNIDVMTTMPGVISQ